MLVGVRIDNPVDAGSLSADFFILAPGSKGAAQTRPVKGVDLWGVAVSGGSGDSIDTAIKAGADFIVIEDESTPGSALLDEDSGRGFVVGSEITDDRARAIDSSPFDFLILGDTIVAMPLDVGATLDIREQLSRYSRHIFLKLDSVPEKSDLGALRDMGISALIYDSESDGKNDLAGLRKTIDGMKPKKYDTSAGAVLPRGDEATHRHDADTDDPDEDEDWE